jgi:DNA-binding CsgD family transcriptional regulator
VATEGLLATGRAALELGRWAEARTAFERALAQGETAESLDGLGTALWWLGETRASVECRTRAYAMFRRARDVLPAFFAAISVAVTHASNYGNVAAALGWVARAERLIDGAGPLRGWVWMLRGYLSGDPGEARELLGRALDVARETGDVDLELIALADLGLQLVSEGLVAQGMPMIDEAMAGTLAGECQHLETVVYASCDMLEACEIAGDLGRARQWCQVADEFIRTYGCPFLHSRCRTHYGAVLVASGEWAQADRELAAAVRMTSDLGPRPRADALGHLADLRLRQGRLEEAEALLARCADAAEAARPAAAAALARGEAGAAVTLLTRHLATLGERHVAAAHALALLVEAQLAAGLVADAAASAARLASAAAGHDQARAYAALASAQVAAAEQRPDEAMASLERALGFFARLELPLETARVRLQLARLLAGQRAEQAVTEATSALAAFDRLGAAVDADAAAALLRTLGVRARPGPKGVGTLTNREQEVLRLVGLGLSNPEIAERLFISRKTAAHHVSRVLAKLGVRNRAEAVAYAAGTRAD